MEPFTRVAHNIRLASRKILGQDRHGDSGMRFLFSNVFCILTIANTVCTSGAFASTTLTVNTELGTSKALYLCGSGDGLSWDPAQGLVGKETSTGSGVWKFNLADGTASGSIDAKVVIADRTSPGTHPIWMSGQNFTLNLNQANTLGSVSFQFPAGSIQLQTITARGLTPTKQIRIYTPATPPTATNKAPVIYALDGQNLFNGGSLTLGTWNLNTTVDEYVGRGIMQAVVIVGIDAADDRINEYTYVGDPTRPGEPGGGGDHFAKETIPDVVNWIEKSSGLQIQKTTASRTILGSSLGGLEATYIGLTTSLTTGGIAFGKILSLSASYWWKNEDLPTRLPELIKSGSLPAIFMSMGTLEGDNADDQAQALHGSRSMDTALKAAGYQTGKTYQNVEIPNATHDEGSWTIRMQTLFPQVFPPVTH